MIPSRLVQAHADVARSIEAEASRAGGAPTARQVQRLAHHYASAAALGHAERACRYLVQAAQGADQALAHQDAAALFEQASSLADPPRRDELRLRAANSHMLGASWARARELDELVATTGDPRQRLQAAIGYETAGWQTGRPGERAVELLSDAMTGVENDTRDPQYVRALAGLSRALAFSGEDDHGLNDTAIEYARALGDGELLADVLETSLGYGLLPRTAAQKQARATELYELAGRGATLRHRSPAAYNLGVIAYLSGDRDGLLRAHADLTRAARLTGQPLWSYAYRAMSYAQQFASGDLAAAQRTCDELLELGQTFGPDDTEGPYGVHSYMIRRETGAVEQVRRLISGREDVGNHWAPGLLALYTELGLAGPARRVLSWLLDQSPSPYEDTAVWPGVLAFCAEAATALEDRDAARRIRPRLAEYSGHNLVLGAFDALFGSADRYLASLDALLAQGCPSESYAAALEMDTRMGATLHQAHTLAQWATYERYAGRAATAADLADRAASLAQPRGLVRVLRALPAGGTAGRPDALTAREQQVLGLLAQGLGNRAIAERLVISENTAANHVRSILVKTGSANRTQAALYGRELHGQ
jgi:DNA-binding CsgD family transcriptional regulator